MGLSPDQSAVSPRGTIIEAVFENPSGGDPFIIRETAKWGSTQYVFRTPPVEGVKNNRDYHVELRLIDPANQHVIATYTKTFRSDVDQSILPERPTVIWARTSTGPARKRQLNLASMLLIDRKGLSSINEIAGEIGLRPRTTSIYVRHALIALLLCSASNSMVSTSHAVVSEHVNPFQRSDFLGMWHGERQEGGSIVKWLIHRDTDGTYAALFLVCKDGVPDWIQKEFGDWDYTNGVYRTITRVIEDSDGRREPDTPDKTRIETYRVIFLNALAFTYVDTKKNKKYSVTKVDDSYKVDCD